MSIYYIVHSRSVDLRKLCVGIKYYIVHICTVCHTTLMVVQLSFLYLGPTVLLYISNERCCNEDQRGVGNLKIEPVIR